MSAAPLEYVGSIHIFLGPYRGNPVALYLRRNGERVAISPKVYPFNSVVGEAETPNKAAADFEEKWKAKGLVAADMYDGPSWEGGIKPERPAPPKPAAPPKPPGTGAAGAPAAPTGKPAGQVPPIAQKPATAATGSTVAPTVQPVPAQPSTGTRKVADSAPSPSASPAPSPEKATTPRPGSSETPAATSVAVPGEPASKPSSS